MAQHRLRLNFSQRGTDAIVLAEAERQVASSLAIGRVISSAGRAATRQSETIHHRFLSIAACARWRSRLRLSVAGSVRNAEMAFSEYCLATALALASAPVRSKMD